MQNGAVDYHTQFSCQGSKRAVLSTYDVDDGILGLASAAASDGSQRLSVTVSLRSEGAVSSTKRIGESRLVAFTLLTPQRLSIAAILFHHLA